MSTKGADMGHRRPLVLGTSPAQRQAVSWQRWLLCDDFGQLDGSDSSRSDEWTVPPFSTCTSNKLPYRAGQFRLPRVGSPATGQLSRGSDGKKAVDEIKGVVEGCLTSEASTSRFCGRSFSLGADEIMQVKEGFDLDFGTSVWRSPNALNLSGSLANPSVAVLVVAVAHPPFLPGSGEPAFPAQDSLEPDASQTRFQDSDRQRVL
jgi:hypothetical protein